MDTKLRVPAKHLVDLLEVVPEEVQALLHNVLVHDFEHIVFHGGC